MKRKADMISKRLIFKSDVLMEDSECLNLVLDSIYDTKSVLFFFMAWDRHVLSKNP